MTGESVRAILIASQSGSRQEERRFEGRERLDETVFFVAVFLKEAFLLDKQLKKGRKWVLKAYRSLVGMACALLVGIQPVYADTIWDRFSSIMQDLYSKLVGLSTIVGVTAASIALMVRMISRNQRAVEEATGWLKRIVVTWIILNSLGFIVAYLQPLIAGGNYTV